MLCTFLGVNPNESKGTYFWVDMNRIALSVFLIKMMDLEPNFAFTNDTVSVKVQFQLTCKGEQCIIYCH